MPKGIRVLKKVWHTRKLGLGVDVCRRLPSRGHSALGASLTALNAVHNITSDLNVVILEGDVSRALKGYGWASMGNLPQIRQSQHRRYP